MRKIGIMGVLAVFIASAAIAGEDVTKSENSVKEQTTHSASTVQENADQAGKTQHQSTTVEHQQHSATSDNLTGNTNTSEKVEVKKSHSKTTSDNSAQGSPESTQEYQQHSETHHQSTTKEVEQ